MKERFSTIQIKGRDVLYAPLRKTRDADLQALLVEAHPDDRIMAQALDDALVRKGVGITIVTLTDGSGSTFTNIDPKTLARTRLHESVDSAEIFGADAIYNAQFPDCMLPFYEDEATMVLKGIAEEIKPAFYIASHPQDPASDHASAYRITRNAAGETPVYAMDGMLGYARPDLNNSRLLQERIHPTHYLPLSRRQDRRRKKGFDAHRTQTENLDRDGAMLVNMVKGMTRERGTELRELTGDESIRFAGTLVFDPKEHGGYDPIAEIFGKDIFIRGS